MTVPNERRVEVDSVVVFYNVGGEAWKVEKFPLAKTAKHPNDYVAYTFRPEVGLEIQTEGKDHIFIPAAAIAKVKFIRRSVPPVEEQVVEIMEAANE